MQKVIITKPAIKLVGITARTNKLNEFHPDKAVIGATMQKYFQNALAQQIANRQAPGTTICAYMDYASDHNGDYTYFIGEEVTDFTDITAGLEMIDIPSQTYCKFTTEKGAMPNIIINAWQEIWAMDENDFGSARAYLADFEVYDQRAQDFSNAALDIYIGITAS